MRRIREPVPDVSFAFESGTRFGYEPSYTDLGRPTTATTRPSSRGPAEEIAVAEDFVKMLVQSQTVTADDLLDRVRAAVGDRLTATHSQTRDFGLVEISAPGVQQGAHAGRGCCARLGIDARDVAAFGDMPNDVDMLQLGGACRTWWPTPTRRCWRWASRWCRATPSPGSGGPSRTGYELRGRPSRSAGGRPDRPGRRRSACCRCWSALYVGATTFPGGTLVPGGR